MEFVDAPDYVVDPARVKYFEDYVRRFWPGLPDGALNYMTPAAFVGPLRPGAHTVEIRLKATGDAFREEPVSEFFPDGFFEFSVVYDVLVN